MDLKIAVAVLVTLTVGVMAVLWLVGKPTQRSRPRSPQHPARWCPGLRRWQARVLAPDLSR